jgi:hypothetical protein
VSSERLGLLRRPELCINDDMKLQFKQVKILYFQILKCTKVSEFYFTVIHHEMGHIQYYLQYAKQSSIFSILSSLHTQTLAKNQPPPGSSINALMDIALQKVSFLPACLVIDKWRWDVFSGAVTQNTWNSHWWKYRKKYQKLKPPVPSSEATDFDPGAQFHVTSGVEYTFLYTLSSSSFTEVCVLLPVNIIQIIKRYLCINAISMSLQRLVKN